MARKANPDHSSGAMSQLSEKRRFAKYGAFSRGPFEAVAANINSNPESP
jgi:hypothetical protein